MYAEGTGTLASKTNGLVIETIDIDQLTPHFNNAKKHPQSQIEQIKESIKRYGMNDPIGVWGEDNVIVEGHGRLYALEQLGIRDIPIIRLDHLTDDERRAYTLIHNQTTMNSDWDADILSDELPDIFDEFNLDYFGFELDSPFEVVEDEVPEPPTEPVAKLGDIWQLGKHRVMCGDSTDAGCVALLMNGDKADMVFTDPPYGNGDSGKYGRGQLGLRTIAGDENFDVTARALKILRQYPQLFFLQWRAFKDAFDYLESVEKGLKTIAVWDKKNAGLGQGMAEQWEAVLISDDVKYKKFGGNVFSISREYKRRDDSPHPHQKPIELLSDLMDFFDYKVLIDPFLGSGSTLITCEQTNRICYGMELDPKYVDVIIQRWENYTGEKAVLISEVTNG